MKRIVLLLIGFVITSAIMAEDINRNTALKKAQQFMPHKEFVTGKVLPSARAKAASKNDAFYIFNAKDNGGYVIVSGDDRTTEILGYAQQGNLDVDQIPENLKWWLDSYARQIEALGTSPEPVEQSEQDYPAAIAPLIKAKWGQSDPYNYMCPDGNFVDYYEEGYDTNYRCVTGCVATAVAQVLYYWKWPESCPALDGYSYCFYPGTDSPFNGYVKPLPATTFKWDKMKNTYKSHETGPSADAVAELMRYCGQALEMSYTPIQSGASIDNKFLDLASIFQYSTQCRYIKRDRYTIGQWESIIYEELAARRPVLYGGGNPALHQFIIDGYDGQGLFHINWGWGGYSDSYYALSVTAKPSVNMDYQFNQDALIGFRPTDTVGETMVPYITSAIINTTDIKTYNRPSSSTDFNDVSLAGNFITKWEQTSTFNAEFGWGLYQNDTFIKKLYSQMSSIPVSERGYIGNNTQISFGADMEEGKYQLYQIYRFEGESEWKRCDDYNGADYLLAKISNTTLTVGLPSTSFVVNSLTTSDEPEVDHNLKIFSNITNMGDTHLLEFSFWIQKPGTSQWIKLKATNAYLDSETSRDIAISFVPNEAGIYNIKITGEAEETLKTITVKVADHETIFLDGLTYVCTPDYQRAKVVANKDSDQSLSDVTIHSSVTANGIDCKVTRIDDRVFYRWNYLASLIIPEGVESIGYLAFSDIYNLTKLVLPSSLKEIGDYVINRDYNLTAIVSHVTEPFPISDNTFVCGQWNIETQQDEYLPSPATLCVPIGTKAKYEALSGWTKFARIEEGEPMETKIDGLRYFYVTGGNNATVIKDDSYQELTEVVIPATITIGDRTYQVIAIDKSTFEDCWKLTSLTLPEGLESIGDYAFAYCQRLTRLELPSSLNEIGKNLIAGSNRLASVISRIIEPFAVSNITFGKENWNDATQQYDISPSHATLYVPIGSKAKYETLSGWTKFARIEEGEPMETKIDGLRYYYVTGENNATVIRDDSYQELTEVVIPATITIGDRTYQVTAIDNSTFESCRKLTSLTLPEGLESIGDYAFAGCQSLTRLDLPPLLKEIGKYVINGDYNLSVIVSHVTEPFPISDNTFVCRQWNTITMQSEDLPSPATLCVPIGAKTKYEAFSGWTQFAKIEEGEPMETKIDGLRYFYVSGGNTATVIRDNSYQELTEVVIPATITISDRTYQVTAIDKNSFKSCRLISLTLPEGLESIGDYAFAYCQSLTKVELPNSMREIGEAAFFNSYMIKTLVIPEGIEYIGDYAFSYIYYLTRLELPSSLRRIGVYVIKGNNALTTVIAHSAEPIAVSDYTFVNEKRNADTQQYDISPSPATLYVPFGTKAKYEAISGWTQFAQIVESEPEPDGITSPQHQSVTDDTWYNLQGVQVKKLQKGVYIRNRKKYISK